MNVIFISQCVGKSKKRTRKILDRYANRIDSNLWQTSITIEGLNSLHGELLTKVSRYTNISCYKPSKVNLSLLWNVGNKKPFFIEQHKIKDTTASVRLICLFAQIAGLSHDLGKFTTMFQDKIKKNGPISDAIRHEWISAYIIDACIKNKFPRTTTDIDSLFTQKEEMVNFNITDSINFKKTPIHSCILWLIISHHKLMGNNGDFPNNSKHVKKIKDTPSVTSTDITPTYNQKEKEELLDIFSHIEHLIIRCKKIATDSSINLKYIRYFSILGRAGLILADHTISAEPYPGNGEEEGYVSFANTKNGKLDQPLTWHLRKVSQTAANMVYQLINYPTVSLSQTTVDNINAPTTNPKYKWQDDAADFVTDKINDISVPVFIINAASTGTGKTRANPKLAMTVCAVRNKKFQLCIGLNLRTLTDQTYTEFKSYWKNTPEELSCIMGTNEVSDILKNIFADDITITDEPDTFRDYDISGELHETPNFLKTITKNNAYFKKLNNVPATISTIDYLINAGNPGRQAHHALSLFKIKNNVLILDEIDSYDPTQLVAIARLLEVAGMMNCDVILSSATTAPLIIKMLFKAFQSGVSAAKQQPTSIPVFFVDEFSKYNEYHLINCCNKVHDVFNDYCKINRSFALTKKYEIVSIGDNTLFEKSVDDRRIILYDTILNNANKLHDYYHTKIDDINVSIGLVRFANIIPLIKFCEWVNPGSSKIIKLCAYHSKHTMLQRKDIETNLDSLLYRGINSPSLSEHQIIKGFVKEAKDTDKKDVILIVVASPVEEIGRDHDFDWGIFDPSGMHFINQGPGRINRHRQKELKSESPANIIILQYNHRTIVNGPKTWAFRYPGLEVKKTFKTHDMFQLLKNNIGFIDKNFRYDDHLLVKEENTTLDIFVSKVNIFLNSTPASMTLKFYYDYSLRDNDTNPNVVYSLYNGKVLDHKKQIWIHTNHYKLKQNKLPTVHWLNDSINYQSYSEYTSNQCAKLGSVSLSVYGNSMPTCTYHEPWGFELT